ncbi:hypothetical protein BDZ88DRAFT_413520 [Geranomyces variabilis]|nr:hypothetical protein BDZ88DRAFT_413520 [Geranomyces variabilis]KAJ3134765.1 hypothetical protein HDU90_004795 [Geranomyces variabilis]
MSAFDVSLVCQTNGRKVQLHAGVTILGRTNAELGLQTEKTLSKQQLKVVVDPHSRTVTVERLGANPSFAHNKALAKGAPLEVHNGDTIHLIKREHPCVFTIVDVPFSSVPQSSQFNPFDFAPSEPVISDGAEDRNGRASDQNGEDDEELDALRAMMAEDDASDDEGPLWPEDFSSESEDIVGSGLSEASDEPSEPAAAASPPPVKTRKKALPKSDVSAANGISSGDALADRIMGAAVKRPRARAAVSEAEKPRAAAKAMPQPTRLRVKRGVRAYGLYAKKARPEAQRQHADMPGPEITLLLKRQWKDLPDEGRQVFEDAAIAHNEALETESGGGNNNSEADVDEPAHEDVSRAHVAPGSATARARPSTVYAESDPENDSDISLRPPRRRAKSNTGASLLLAQSDSGSEPDAEVVHTIGPAEAFPITSFTPRNPAHTLGNGDDESGTTDDDDRCGVPTKADQPAISASVTSVGQTQPRSFSRGVKIPFSSSSETE